MSPPVGFHPPALESAHLDEYGHCHRLATNLGLRCEHGLQCEPLDCSSSVGQPIRPCQDTLRK